MASTRRDSPPWSVRMGVLLLFVVSIGASVLMGFMAVFAVATIGLPGAQMSIDQLVIGVFGIAVPALVLLTAVCFTLRHHTWARWLAVAISIGGGTVALVLQLAMPSPAAFFMWAAAAAIVGGTLLALPTAGDWFARRMPRVQLPLAR